MFTSPILIFDIETVPDVVSGRAALGLDDIDDENVVRAMSHRRRQKTGGSDFLALHYHRIVAISVALKEEDSFRVWSLGDTNSNEKELIERFFSGVERYDPTIVSWNGSGFDLPVIHYRALYNSVVSKRYWETGDTDREFKWNNYVNRYHWRHIDLMDVLSGFQARGAASLEEISQLLGLPGKLGVSGSDVWALYNAGQIEDIRNYCETDVLNTYLIFLRFQYIRGRLNKDRYSLEIEKVKSSLADDSRPHLMEFLSEWKQPNIESTVSGNQALHVGEKT